VWVRAAGLRPPHRPDLAEDGALRADPRRFAVTHDRVLAEVEPVVAHTDRYSVVATREGTPAAVAVAEDPRGSPPGSGGWWCSSNQDPLGLVPQRLVNCSTRYSPQPDSAPGGGRRDPETVGGRGPGRRSCTWTRRRVPDQWAVTWIRSSGARPAWRRLLETSGRGRPR
jgi:hypothetical protein